MGLAGPRPVGPRALRPPLASVPQHLPDPRGGPSWRRALLEGAPGRSGPRALPLDLGPGALAS
eukprot:15014604-Alexandrium_andersonii.AAC.1